MDFSNLIHVEYHGEKVLSTRQIADAYGCTVQLIRQNFAANKEQFIEGVHYFKLEGAELAEFKMYIRNLKAQMQTDRESTACAVENLPCTKLASSLYLWTVQGAVRHCKLVGTKQAWQVFTVLEKSYFGKMQAAQNEETAEQTPQPYSNDNPPPFWQLLKIIRDRLLIKFAEKILGEKLF